MAEEVFTNPDLFDDIHCQGPIIHGNSIYRMLYHVGKLIIYNELAKIKCDSTFKHSQTIYQVGACQRRYQACKGFFMASLYIGDLSIALSTGNVTRKVIVACQPSYRPADYCAFRGSHRR